MQTEAGSATEYLCRVLDEWHQEATSQSPFLEPQADRLDGMYLPMEKAEMVLSLLLEGNSVSNIERVTGERLLRRSLRLFQALLPTLQVSGAHI